MIDDVLIRLMKKLNLEIPEFTLKRRIVISKIDKDQSDPSKKVSPTLFLRGVDQSGAPYTLFKKVVVTFDGKECQTKVSEPVFMTPTKADLNNC